MGVLASYMCALSEVCRESDASAWDNWAGAVAAALTAATDWAHGLQSSPVPYNGDNTATSSGKQQQCTQQCMQEAAFHLGKAAKQLLLPCVSAADKIVPQWGPLPGLLTSLAGFCGITSEALEAFVQVCGPCCDIHGTDGLLLPSL